MSGPTVSRPTRALICGATGQDGAYLARLLLQRGYEVHGTSRRPEAVPRSALDALGIRHKIRLHRMVPSEFPSVEQVLSSVRPDEVYYLAGQSSVARSFEEPDETMAGIEGGTLNLLEAVRSRRLRVRMVFAGSGDCFGDTKGVPADETTPFRPCSPYGAAKAAACRHVTTYRERHGLHACSAFLFNHESPLRQDHYVTQRIVIAACRIAGGATAPLMLGNLDVSRDWGWAPEYVDAMWRMLQPPEPRDYVIATGSTFPLRAFAERAFATLGLDWRAYVRSDASLVRPSDISISCANPARAREDLGWSATMRMPEVADAMIAARCGAMAPGFAS